MPWKTPNAVSTEESLGCRRSRGAAGGPAALAGHDVHVGDVRADIAGRHITPAERGHEAAVGQQEFLGLDLLGVTDDDGLAAAVVETGHGVLVRHAAREVQRVRDRLLLGGVRVETGAAEGRAQSGGVQGDDGLEAAGAVLAEHDLFVAPLIRVEQGVQDAVGHIGHCGDSQVRSGGKTLLKVGKVRADRHGRSVRARA